MRKLNSRTFHRYLSVLIGVQIFLWTLSGLLFSWLALERVRGEHLMRPPERLDLGQLALVDPASLFSRAVGDTRSTVSRVELRAMLGRPVFEVELTDGGSAHRHFTLFDAQSGELLSPVSAEVAGKIAQRDFSESAEVSGIELLTSSPGSHSEYREKELPAWRVVLDHPSQTVIYVSAQRGVVTARRNGQWRIFDFFWMLHTMDFQGRDDINNWLLRILSALAVATVLSGYWLWWRSSRIRRRWKKRTGRSLPPPRS